MPALVAWAVIVVNAVTFLVWGIDKWQARRNGRRVPEAHLLLLAATTGCAGAWLGVTVFRHKRSKLTFKLLLVVSTLVNVLWVWLGWKLGLLG